MSSGLDEEKRKIDIGGQVRVTAISPRTIQLSDNSEYYVVVEFNNDVSLDDLKITPDNVVSVTIYKEENGKAIRLVKMLSERFNAGVFSASVYAFEKPSGPVYFNFSVKDDDMSIIIADELEWLLKGEIGVKQFLKNMMEYLCNIANNMLSCPW